MSSAEFPVEASRSATSNKISPEFAQFLQQSEGEVEKTKFIHFKGDKSPNSESVGDSLTKFNSGDGLTDFRNINIHPRFESSSFQIHDKIDTIREAPIEYYESILYDLCRRYNLELFSKKITTKCIEIFHHIYRLKAEEDDLSPNEVSQLNSHFEDVLTSFPKILQEYELFKETLTLMSALAVKWKIANLDQYSYRLTGRSMNIKMLDLRELNTNLFTCETIWIATMIKQDPFIKIADDQVTQYASLLLQVAIKLVNSILSLNQHCNLNNTPTIAGLVASKNPRVSRFSGVEPNYDAEVVAYQRLKLKRGLLSFCVKDRDLKTIREIKSLLEDFENVYRQFEQSLMVNILSMSKRAKDVV